MTSFLALGALGARRSLAEHDLHYGFDGFNVKYGTRAPTLFTSEAHFHERLYEHEVGLPDGQVQSYLVSLEQGVFPDRELRSDLEARAKVTIDTVVDGDVLMHGTREHADALRELPEVRKVVPLVPELKLTPHFDALLPRNRTVSLNVRLVTFARHEHLRATSAELAPRYARALRARCATDWAARASCAAANGIGVEAHSDKMLAAVRLAPEDALVVAEALADEPEVYWIEPHPEFRVRNAEAAAIVQSGSTTLDGNGAIIGTTPVWDMGIRGEGEVIGCGDSGLDTGHCFFEDATGGTATNQNYGPDHRKVVGYRAYADGEATGTYDHGTHVVGSILGQSSTPGAAGSDEGGVAPAAKVSFTDIGPGDAPGLQVPNDLANNYFNVDYDNGARVHTNSWGASVNAYTTSSYGVDESMYLNDDLAILFAAGNDGGNGLGTIGSPATCKNCITVGASENPQSGGGRNDGNLASFSSLGPGVGERIKPDVVAPGFFITSANSNSPGDCPTTEMAGTSMATPVTAGATALIRQYFRQGFYPRGVAGDENGDGTFAGGRIPSGALMKAMLVASAQHMSGDGVAGQEAVPTSVPNIAEGFGRIQLDRVLFAAEDGLNAGDRLLVYDYLLDPTASVSNGQTISLEIPTRAADPILGSAVKVVLVWTDPPGQPIANQYLINNLDLTVTHNGQQYVGNSPRDLGAGGATDVQTAPDAENTVETVEIANANSQTVTVTVTGTDVSDGPQKFALVVTGPLATDSPPPAAPAPPPPKPPRPPPAPLQDVVVLGVSLPLLIVALLAGGGFCFKRAKGGGSLGRSSLKPLPPGWKMLTDPSTGAPFYVNEATGQRQWEPPPATAPTAKSDLPPGWHAQTDPNSGQTYYVNEKTQSSQWEKPMPVGAAATRDAPVAPKADAGGLPPNWQAGTDPASGRTYWFNTETKASQWTPP